MLVDGERCDPFRRRGDRYRPPGVREVRDPELAGDRSGGAFDEPRPGGAVRTDDDRAGRAPWRATAAAIGRRAQREAIDGLRRPGREVDDREVDAVRAAALVGLAVFGYGRATGDDPAGPE